MKNSYKKEIKRNKHIKRCSTAPTGKCKLKQYNTVGRNLNWYRLFGGQLGNFNIKCIYPTTRTYIAFPENYMPMYKKRNI